MTAPVIILLLLAGACVGSFLNVVAWRLPRGESLLRPRSHCPSCGAHIGARDNAPVLSWLLLRGRCRACGTPISPRYPVVEAGTAALWVGCGLRFGFEPELALALVFVTVLVAVSAIDLEHRIIPNSIMLVAAPAGIALAAWVDSGQIAEHLIAGAAAGLPLALIAFAKPGAMGMGDGKLAAVMGLYLGREVAPALLIGFAVGAIVGVALMARHGAGERKRAVPFGPFLALGGVVALFAGEPIVEWYLDSFIRQDG